MRLLARIREVQISILLWQQRAKKCLVEVLALADEFATKAVEI
jgi:phage gp46-like protein